MSKYQFRREDNGEIVTVDFETMMEQNAAGFITLPDGVLAKRCREATLPKRKGTKELPKQPVSDAMGFIEQQFEDFESDRKRHGFRGIEFVRDKDVPQFFQVRASSPAAMARYMKHRGLRERTTPNGSRAELTPCQLEQARRKILEKYPETKPCAA